MSDLLDENFLNNHGEFILGAVDILNDKQQLLAEKILEAASGGTFHSTDLLSALENSKVYNIEDFFLEHINEYSQSDQTLSKRISETINTLTPGLIIISALQQACTSYAEMPEPPISFKNYLSDRMLSLMNQLNEDIDSIILDDNDYMKKTINSIIALRAAIEIVTNYEDF